MKGADRRHVISGATAFLIAVLLFPGCSTPRNAPLSAEAFQAVVESELGPDATCEPNPTSLFRLCQARTMRPGEMPGVGFFTYDVERGEITYRGEVAGGPVRWAGTYLVEAFRTIGTIQKEGEMPDTALRIDARTGKGASGRPDL